MRTWPGIAALGAGIIHLGVAAGSPLALLIPLVAIGAAELLWGFLALARPMPPAPLPALVVVAIAVGAWVVALVVPAAAHHMTTMTDPLPVSALAGGALLDLVVGALLAVHLRRGRPAAGPVHPVVFLLTAGVAAGLVAVLTTASLAGTSVGGPMRMH